MSHWRLVQSLIKERREKRIPPVWDAIGLYRGYLCACDQAAYYSVEKSLKNSPRLETAVFFGMDRDVYDAWYYPRWHMFLAMVTE